MRKLPPGASSTGASNAIMGGSGGGWSTGLGREVCPWENCGDCHKTELLLYSVIKGEMEIKLPEIKRVRKKVASDKIR